MQLTNTEPIFLQVKNFYRRLILLGALKEGDPLPSVRDVAMENRINPNTVVKAYAMLKDEGLVEALPKKGYFVKAKGDDGRGERLESLINEILKSGYSLEEIEHVLEEKREKL